MTQSSFGDEGGTAGGEACEGIWLLLHSYAHLLSLPLLALSPLSSECWCLCGEDVQLFVFFCVSMHVCVLGFVWTMNSMLPSALSHAVCDTEA